MYEIRYIKIFVLKLHTYVITYCMLSLIYKKILVFYGNIFLIIRPLWQFQERKIKKKLITSKINTKAYLLHTCGFLVSLISTLSACNKQLQVTLSNSKVHDLNFLAVADAINLDFSYLRNSALLKTRWTFFQNFG